MIGVAPLALSELARSPWRTLVRVLTLASAVEANSEHPLAKAVVAEAKRRNLPTLPAADFKALAGRGRVKHPINYERHSGESRTNASGTYLSERSEAEGFGPWMGRTIQGIQRRLDPWTPASAGVTDS